MKYQPFLLVIALGLAARAALAVSLGGYIPPSDATFYMTLAQHARDGSGLWIDNEVYGPNLRALFPPIYPLLLSVFGSAVALSAAFDSATAYLIYRLAGRNPVAAAIFFLWPTLILNSVVPQKESLVMLLVAALLYVRRASVFGLCGGLLALTQPALVFFPLILSAMRGWKYAATVALFMALTLSPWIIRNALVLGEFVPLTTGAGASLAYVANGGRHVSPSPEILALPEVARFAAVGWDALAVILADPLAYLSQVGTDLGRAFLFDTFTLERLRLASSVPVQVLHLLLLGVAVIGLRNSDRPALLAVGLTLLTMVWFEFGERHRYFLYPLVAVMAAQAARRLDRRGGAEIGNKGHAGGVVGVGADAQAIFGDGPDPRGDGFRSDL